jgi:hypothetical protein
MAHNVSYCSAVTGPELGVNRKLPAGSQSDAFDPQATLTVTNGNALEAGFWPLSKSVFEPLGCPEV